MHPLSLVIEKIKTAHGLTAALLERIGWDPRSYKWILNPLMPSEIM